MLFRAMVGQQITVAAARTALIRLSAAGSETAHQNGGLHRLFPTPAQVAETGFSLPGGPQRRSDSLRAVASAVASGTVDFGYGDDLPSLQAKLLPLPGIGPWTVGYVAMRVLGAPDIFLANDAAVRNGIRALPAGDPSSTGDFSTMSPWRSYATMHLWRAAGKARTDKARTDKANTGMAETATRKITT
jgi:AraC family transcriptional regulator, regulatory protein of adaptative response / DNA-3-methyladenine glycosylase II